MNTILRMVIMIIILVAVSGCSTINSRIQGAIGSMPWTQKEVDPCPPSYGVTHCYKYKRMKKQQRKIRSIIAEGRLACKMPKGKFFFFEATRIGGKWFCPKKGGK